YQLRQALYASLNRERIINICRPESLGICNKLPT
ncbi:MAG: hypothetical protein ACI8XX_001884, partial [Polaribacter sp.]